MLRERHAALVGLALALAAATPRAEDKPGAGAQDSAAAGVQDKLGGTLFVQICGPCHQPDGAGTPGLAPPLKGPHWQKLTAERTYLPRVIAFGLTGQIKVGDAVFAGGMQPQAQLNDEQATAVANYVASVLNEANLAADWKPYTAAEISAVRATPHSSVEQRQLRKHALGL
jgi:mono/diheme cytochrome c family protein